MDGHCIEAEIFSTGCWNGECFSETDLREIARNFNKLKTCLKPPLKFGHEEGQTLLGQSDGDPALGWVASLRVQGDRLLAKFEGLPTVVFEAIRQGRYRRVSAELYFNVRRHGRKLGKALKAVALLGADLPAVHNLKDLSAYLASGNTTTFTTGAVKSYALPSLNNQIITSTREDSDMPDLERNDALQAELAELRAYKDRQDSEKRRDTNRRKAEAFRSVREEALTYCEEQVRAGTLSPHLKHGLVKEIEGQSRAFAEGEPLRVSFEWVRHLLEQAAPTLPRGEMAFSTSADGLEVDANPSRTLARLAADKMTELGISYGEASEYILRTRPDLASAYRNFTLNPIT